MASDDTTRTTTSQRAPATRPTTGAPHTKRPSHQEIFVRELRLTTLRNILPTKHVIRECNRTRHPHHMHPPRNTLGRHARVCSRNAMTDKDSAKWYEGESNGRKYEPPIETTERQVPRDKNEPRREDVVALTFLTLNSHSKW